MKRLPDGGYFCTPRLLPLDQSILDRDSNDLSSEEWTIAPGSLFKPQRRDRSCTQAQVHHFAIVLDHHVMHLPGRATRMRKTEHMSVLDWRLLSSRWTIISGILDKPRPNTWHGWEISLCVLDSLWGVDLAQTEDGSWYLTSPHFDATLMERSGSWLLWQVFPAGLCTTHEKQSGDDVGPEMMNIWEFRHVLTRS